MPNSNPNPNQRTGLAPINECTVAAVAGTRMRRPSEDYVQCWADLPEMYALPSP